MPESEATAQIGGRLAPGRDLAFVATRLLVVLAAVDTDGVRYFFFSLQPEALLCRDEALDHR